MIWHYISVWPLKIIRIRLGAFILYLLTYWPVIECNFFKNAWQRNITRGYHSAIWNTSALRVYLQISRGTVSFISTAQVYATSPFHLFSLAFPKPKKAKTCTKKGWYSELQCWWVLHKIWWNHRYLSYFFNINKKYTVIIIHNLLSVWLFFFVIYFTL